MANPRRRYPSDHRSYIRLLESFLDDPKVCALSLEDQGLFVRLLLTLNRQESRDGKGTLGRFAACALAQRERWAYAKPAYDRLAAGGLLRVRYEGDTVEYESVKWAEIQGFTPVELRPNSDQTPSPRGEEKRGEEKRVNNPARSAHATVDEPEVLDGKESEPDPEKLVNILGSEPGEREAKLAWLRRELPLIALKASEDHPSDAKRRMAGIRSRVLSHYRQHHKAATQSPLAIPINGSRMPDSDELGRLSRERLLLMPTLEYWREWKAAGKPDVAFWWVPEPDRPVF